MATEATPSRQLQKISSSKVRVVVRVRPFLPCEIECKKGNPISCVSIVNQEHDQGQEVSVLVKDQLTSRSECYKVDSFFGQDNNNVNRIFYEEVSPLIPGVICGSNATVFAYGATGSGKTFTMQGKDEFAGLISLSVSAIMAICKDTRSTVEISYFEVHMEKCFDLLDSKAKEFAVMDDEDGRTHLKGLTKLGISSMEVFKEIFACCIQRRKVSRTGINDISSRSHAVLVVAVSTPSDTTDAFVTGKLNLIDLAGNEDNRRSCNDGLRLQESVKINQSLFALSNVIYALNNRQTRVPYRESKLTRILQDSIGGTSKSLMVACLNPGEYQECVYTVSLAARSRQISSSVPSSNRKQETPKTKVDMEAKLQAWLESKGKIRTAQKGCENASLSLKCHVPWSSAKKGAICINSTPKPVNSLTKQPSRKLFDLEVEVNSQMKSLGNSQKAIPNSDKLILESKTTQDSQQMMNLNTEFSSAASPHIATNVQSSTTLNILSPVDPNIERLKVGLTSCSESVEPMSPCTPSIISSQADKMKSPKTPLSKFKAMSSNLKSSLSREYVGFLNTASKEELMEIKGIGKKMAEYIAELREESPIKSIDDLEKMGLSSKQVHNLFNSAARGVFG